MSNPPLDLAAEWLEADSQGGFASGTVGGARTRRYHALLLTATTPPSGRVVLVNGLVAWIEAGPIKLPLTTQFYAPSVVDPDITEVISSFTRHPWPSWTFTWPDHRVITHDVFVAPASCETLLRWRQVQGTPCVLKVRLLLSGRDYHALHHENPAFNFEPHIGGGNVSWRPYPSLPAFAALTNGSYFHDPEWYRNFRYTEETARGLDDIEDLASPGIFTFDLSESEAVIILRAGDDLADCASQRATALRANETARRALEAPLQHAAGCYEVARGSGQTLIAGFPWFTDWGRDTFIAMRGLIIAENKLQTAEAILLAWASAVSEGMLPNRFPDTSGPPEYNAVDSSLWYIVAVEAFLRKAEGSGYRVSSSLSAALRDACQAILSGYTAGTRFRVGVDTDGLLSAGMPGVQMTWMDAITEGHVVTPRIGKPVEVQALWINALEIGASRWSGQWAQAAQRARAAFVIRFANPAGGLYDVVDVDHVAGTADASIRPNQILAIGGLPFPILAGDLARRVVDLVEAKLLTPFGLRSLSPDDRAYKGRYHGGPAERDGAYHQGTVWPWLLGPFVDAWLAVRGRTKAAKAEASARFLPPLMAHLEQAGLGHISEVFDGDAPHTPGGCPFQAWSLGELIRMRSMLL